MSLRILTSLFLLLVAASTASAQNPQFAPTEQLRSPAVTGRGVQAESLNNAQSQGFSVQSAEPGRADGADVFSPPANFVAPPPKKADDDPGDAPLLIPIPPAQEVPFNTAEYRSNKIPWEQFPTAAASPAQ